MKNLLSRYKVLLICIVVLACFATAAFVWTNKSSPPENPNGILTMKAPFEGVANAQDSAAGAAIGAKLDEEAGISAYYKSPDAINLSQVRGQFRTIETETADYIIGSVGVPNFPENFDVHVYVHNTGWILAYYMRSDPVSKIVDLNARTINNTNLKSVVAMVAGAAGAPFTDVTYYDFRYPNATNIMFVAEDLTNGNQFTIQLPSSYGYFERGWALTDYVCCGDYFQLDGVNLTSMWSGNYKWYGIITASQLLPDITHTIILQDYGVLVLEYKVP